MARGRGRGSKRKASAASSSESPSKLAREDSENTQLKKALVKAEQEAVKPSKAARIDATFARGLRVPPSTRVCGEYAAMLNQTNIGANNNKFYVIQIVEHAGSFFLFTKWGRVGEPGLHNIGSFDKLEDAVKGFCKKYQDKTGNKWGAEFVAKNKKYTPLEMEVDSDDDSPEDSTDGGPGSSLAIKRETNGCSLDHRTMIMIKLIFCADMFSGQMVNMNLDIKKMPLGKLSKAQIGKGLAALIEVEEALKNKASRDTIAELSSKFFTLIPHNFGRTKPPILDSAALRTKKDVMLTLADIELAQSLQTKPEPGLKHELDVKYESLGCQTTLLSKTCEEYELVLEFARATVPSFKLLDVWRLERAGEEERLSLKPQRRLLWHGTSVAVVAAILNSGLRIMPHSGGRMGRGIYLASECAKSYGYVQCHYGEFEQEKDVGFMFLVEAQLGRTKDTPSGDYTLKAAPEGYDSIVARGVQEPDPSKDKKMTLSGGREVVVPVGKPVKQKKYSNSEFWQSEYLVYQECQARLRYLIKFSRNWN